MSIERIEIRPDEIRSDGKLRSLGFVERNTGRCSNDN